MEGFIRPTASILPEHALVPQRNLISPAPNQFTHELTRPQPYYFGGFQASEQPDGFLAVGARVVLMGHDGGKLCRVVDARGLYVEVEYESLRRL